MILSAFVIPLAAALTAAAMAQDAMRLRLPNLLMLALLLLYPLGLWLLPGQWGGWASLGWDGLLALGMLALGFGLFAVGMLGAGDVKMLAIAMLWVGWRGAGEYLSIFALLGGAECVLLLAVRWLLARPFVARHWPEERLPRLLRRRGPVPYGLAIGGGLLYFWW